MGATTNEPAITTPRERDRNVLVRAANEVVGVAGLLRIAAVCSLCTAILLMSSRRSPEVAAGTACIVSAIACLFVAERLRAGENWTRWVILAGAVALGGQSLPGFAMALAVVWALFRRDANGLFDGTKSPAEWAGTSIASGRRVLLVAVLAIVAYSMRLSAASFGF